MIKIGMIGISEGNGHPYSFSAIFNGYDKEEMKKSGWVNILSYLEKEPENHFGIQGAQISHVWCQDPTESQKIAQASKIPNVCSTYQEMIDSVDAVIIARDDWESHYEIAKPFLLKGKFVLIDKPLSLDVEECNFFKKFIEEGLLVSFSSLGFSPELDELKNKLSTFGEIKLIRGITPKNWEKYGIHLLDGIAGTIDFTPTYITSTPCAHESIHIQTQEGFIIQLDCLGALQYPMLQLEFFSQQNYYQANCLNAFASFKRLLTYFVDTIKGNTNITQNLHTLKQMEILREGKKKL